MEPSGKEGDTLPRRQQLTGWEAQKAGPLCLKVWLCGTVKQQSSRWDPDEASLQVRPPCFFTFSPVPSIFPPSHSPENPRPRNPCLGFCFQNLLEDTSLMWRARAILHSRNAAPWWQPTKRTYPLHSDPNQVLPLSPSPLEPVSHQIKPPSPQHLVILSPPPSSPRFKLSWLLNYGNGMSS